VSCHNTTRHHNPEDLNFNIISILYKVEEEENCRAEDGETNSEHTLCLEQRNRIKCMKMNTKIVMPFG